MHKNISFIAAAVVVATVLQVSAVAMDAIPATEAVSIVAEEAESPGDADEPPQPAKLPKPDSQPEPQPEYSDEDIMVMIDGMRYDMNGKIYQKDDVNYLPIADIAKGLGAETVTTENDGKTFRAEGENVSVSINCTSSYMEVNGRYFYLPDGCPIENGELILPIRKICAIFGVDVKWNDEESTLYLTTGKEPMKTGDEFYGSDDVYWLSRIIYAEARGESFMGKIAVGNVVMNRKASSSFPGTVKDVIFDRRCGIQFSPAYSGGIYNNPTSDCIIAAKIALEGYSVVGGSLYFSPTRYATTSWASRNRRYGTRIGNHVFFL